MGRGIGTWRSGCESGVAGGDLLLGEVAALVRLLGVALHGFPARRRIFREGLLCRADRRFSGLQGRDRPGKRGERLGRRLLEVAQLREALGLSVHCRLGRSAVGDDLAVHPLLGRLIFGDRVVQSLTDPESEPEFVLCCRDGFGVRRDVFVREFGLGEADVLPCFVQGVVRGEQHLIGLARKVAGAFVAFLSAQVVVTPGDEEQIHEDQAAADQDDRDQGPQDRGRARVTGAGDARSAGGRARRVGSGLRCRNLGGLDSVTQTGRERGDSACVVARLERRIESSRQQAVDLRCRQARRLDFPPAVAMIVDRYEEDHVVAAEPVGLESRARKCRCRRAVRGGDEDDPELNVLAVLQNIERCLHLGRVRPKDARLVRDLAGELWSRRRHQSGRHEQEQTSGEHERPNGGAEPGSHPHAVHPTQVVAW